jgi:hypothetical protein
MSGGSRKRSFAKTAEFPRWIVAATILLIGIMLLLGALSDASGRLRIPGVGSALYLSLIIAIAAVIIYSGRRSSQRVRRDSPLRARRR